MQEGFLARRLEDAATPRALLRKYAQVMVNGYSFLADLKLHEAEEKLAHYSQLLKELEGE
jgi:hypothetical protein